MLRNKLLAVLLCAVLLTGCAQTAAPTVPPAELLPTKPATNYKTTEVVRGSFQLSSRCNANFYYPEPKNLLCEYNNAILTDSVVFSERSEFSKGDVIASFRFDASPAELERMELEHYQSSKSVADQIASYEQRIEQYTRAAAAGGTDGQIARLQLEKAQNELIIYKEKSYVNLAKQAQALEEYRELFEPKTLVAPEDGMVLNAVSYDEDTVLKKDAVVLTYTTGTPKLLKLNSPGKEFSLLATPGMTVCISRGKQDIMGTIVASPTGISDTLDNQSIYVDSPQLQELEYRSYFIVECTLLALEDMLLLDEDAIHQDDTSTYVMVLENGNAVKREVLCGLADGGMICILDGLEEGQQVILNY